MTAGTLEMSMDIKNQEEAGVRIEYYTLDGRHPEIYMCPGDLHIICNVMHDYAALLESLVPEKEGYEQAIYEYHAGRCKKIQQKIEESMNYNVEQAIEKCRKKKGKEKDDDIGEDALVLAARRRGKEAKADNKESQKPQEKPNRQSELHQMTITELLGG